MKLIHHEDWRGNFGDDINIPFFEEILPKYHLVRPDLNLYGIGTLLNNNNLPTIKNSIIFGSGFGYSNDLKWDPKSTTVFGVRGPLTARAMQLNDQRYVIGDPAIYAVTMDRFNRGTSATKCKRIVALHHRSSELWDFGADDKNDLYFLDPGLIDISTYIATIRNANVVYAESLHGAIVASTFGIPWHPIWIRNPLEKVKWADFMELIQIPQLNSFQVPAPPVNSVRRVLVSGRMRKFIMPNIHGRLVNDEDVARISRSLDSISQQQAIETSAHLIASLQYKIQDAIEDLVRFSQ